MQGICDLVRETCKKAEKKAEHVKINKENLQKLAKQFQDIRVHNDQEWADCPFHYFNKHDEETTIAYIFILDTLNFCFWPSPTPFEYDTLATNLKNIAENKSTNFTENILLTMQLNDFKKYIFNDIDFPMIEERYRLFRETCQVCIEHFEGRFINFIKAANKSAEKLVEIVTQKCKGFQDHAISNGEQIFFYKRAQILVGDIYSAFKGEGIGEFSDIHKLTMFADYRVPQILYDLGVLEYSEKLKSKILEGKVLKHGGKYEVEIRAITVICVELLREELSKCGMELTSIRVDHILWQKGEAEKDKIFPHHKTLSIFY